MQSLGNDFIVMHFKNLEQLKNFKHNIVKICNRKTGIGCDQFVAVIKKKIIKAEVQIVLFNQDGSFAKMCANALKCVSGDYLKQYQNKKKCTVAILQEDGDLIRSVDCKKTATDILM